MFEPSRAQWIASFERFFCEDGRTAHSSITARAMALTYGVCDPCDAHGGNRSHVRAANMAAVRAAYETHLSTVAARFRGARA